MASNITTNGVDTDELYLMRDKVIIDAIQGPELDEGFQLWAVGGSNDFGQLGTGNTNKILSPIQIGSDFDWARVTAHGYNTFAIKTNGTLWGWGANFAGNLGTGDRSLRLTPTQIGTDDDWLDVGVGYNKTFGLKKDGTAWMWGFNYRGSFGIGNENSGLIFTTPVQVASSVVIAPKRMIAENTFFVAKDGNLKASGLRVPVGLSNFNPPDPNLGFFNNCVFATPVPVLPGVYEIDLETRKPIGFEKFYSPAPSARGGWQRPSFGARYYGDAVPVRNNSILSTVIGGAQGKGYLGTYPSSTGFGSFNGRVKIFDTGAGYFLQNNYPSYQQNNSSMIVDTDGRVFAYGVGRYELIGIDGSYRNVGFPYTDWVDIACQAGSFMAIREEGSLWAWGLNFNGILGIGNERQLRRASTETILTKINDRNNWKSVVMGKKHSMALRRRN